MIRIPRTILVVAAIAGGSVALASPASAYEYGPVYATCGEAHEAGVYDIPEDDPAYWPDGDADDDGIACESSK